MKILLLDQFAEIGGAQRCTLDLIPAFNEREWHVHALIPSDGPYAAALRAAGGTVSSIPCGPFQSAAKTKTDAVRFAMQLPAQVSAIRTAARDTDAVYVIGPRLLPAVALARPSAPVIFHAHSAVTQVSAGAIARLSLKAAHADLIACCDYVATPLRGTTPKIQVIYNGVPAHRTRERSASRIAVIGRIAPEKGQLDFVRAARVVLQHHPAANFAVVGSPMFSSTDYYNAVRAAAADLPIVFQPWVDNVNDVLSSCALIVVPSTAVDATPRIILEAFSAAVPVLSFASGGISELIDHNRTGILVAERSPAALASAILDALATPDKLDRLGAAGYQRWTDFFNVDRYRSEVCSFIAAVCERHHQRAPLSSAGASARA